MNEFLVFFNEKRRIYGWSLEIYYSSIMDWCITIGYKTTHPKHGDTILHVQSCDMEYVFAKAQVELKEWLLENEGGY
jgi:hypothetical protein